MWMDHVFQLVHPFCTLPHCVQTRVQLITSHGRESRQHVAPPDLFSLSNSRCGAWLRIVRKGSNWLAASCSAFWALWREVRPALAVGPLWLEHNFASCLKSSDRMLKRPVSNLSVNVLAGWHELCHIPCVFLGMWHIHRGVTAGRHLTSHWTVAVWP